MFPFLNLFYVPSFFLLLQETACYIMLLYYLRIFEHRSVVWIAVTRERGRTLTNTCFSIIWMFLSSPCRYCTTFCRWISKITLFNDLCQLSCFHFEFSNSRLLLACKVQIFLGLCLKKIYFWRVNVIDFRSMSTSSLILVRLESFTTSALADDSLAPIDELLHLIILRKLIEICLLDIT